MRRSGRVLMDAVWIKDANVAEALRRGAEELWLVWCIGNHGVYRDGAFQQYVHMIEIAANGALQEELALVRDRGVRLHVIRPRVPLPLDPDLFFGRVDAGTLVAMGYRDAAAYLDAPHAEGVPADATATRMADPVPGVAYRERLEGGGLQLRLAWEIDDLEAFAERPQGTLVGDATHPALGTRRPARSGRFRVEDGEVAAELDFGGVRMELRRRLGDPRGLEARLDGGAPVRLARRGPAPWLALTARGTGSAREATGALAEFSRWFAAAR